MYRLPTKTRSIYGEFWYCLDLNCDTGVTLYNFKKKNNNNSDSHREVQKVLQCRTTENVHLDNTRLYV